MKKIIAFLLALAMLLSLAACGGGTEEVDPNAGKYIGISAAVGGFSMPMSDIYPGETWIELKSGGKGDIMLDGDSYPMTWALEGETFTLTLEGVDSVGTLSDGVIEVDLMNMGCVMTFEKEGSNSADKAAAQATYNDAGYYDLIRIDGATEEDSVSEEDMALVRSMGMYMYLELLPDGTGTFFVDEEMAVTWVDGTVNFTEDNMSINYTLENGELVLDMLEAKLFFRKGEKPVPVVSEMEQAGFTDFIEVGVPYAYTTACFKDETKSTTAEVTVTSYEIVESAEKLEAREDYEWRVVTMEARFYDDNAYAYGMSFSYQTEDYYNTKLHDDTNVKLEDNVAWKDYYTADLESYTIIYQGQEMEAYCRRGEKWGGWVGRENTLYLLWAFQVPIGYDGCVAGVGDARVEWADGTYITDYDPADFLLFRLDNQASGAAADDGILAGTYSLYAMDDAGEYIGNDTLVLLGMDGMLDVTFQDDGTGVMRVDTEELTFTYDETQIVDAEGSVYGYALKDGMLELYFGDDQTFYCQKQ